MTAECLGGTSSRKEGVGETIALTGGAIAGLLNTVPIPWAIPLGAYVGLLSYNVVNLCDTDPPADPGITAADALALIGYLDPIGHTTAVSKFSALIARYLWFQVCKCDSVATPPRPAPPAAPVGLPSINPPIVGPPGPLTTPCFTRGARVVDVTAPPSGWGLSAVLFKGIVPTLAVLKMVNTVATAPGVTVRYNWEWGLQRADGGITVIRTDTYTLAPSQTLNAQITPPAGCDVMDGTIQAVSGSGMTHVSADFDLYCNGDIPTTSPSPCPDDGVTQAMLSQILDLVKLIQRQKVPFAYVPGSRHNGLSGNGQFAVQGIIGASVIITTLPAYLGNIAGDPPELFDVGFVTLGTADGWHRSVRIEHSPTLVLPIEGSETLLGYSLSPGVVVDILELRRES